MPRLPDLGVVLVLDGPKGELGEIALALVRIGLDALYSNDAHEGALLIRQEGRRVGGVLVNADAPLEHVEELIETIHRETGLHPEATALLGDRPPATIRSEFLDRGLRWCLWTPFTPEALRFIGGLALWEGNDASLRLDLRVPLRIEARLSCRGQEQRARVTNLSRGGARLEVATRLPPGRRVQLEVGAPDEAIRCNAIVRWTSAFQSARHSTAPPAMGVEFENPSATVKKAIQALLERGLAPFRIDAEG